MTRSESPEERLDRLFNDLLQELRVMQTGTQLLAGFLLTLPFQGAFDGLDEVQRGTYVVLVLLTAVTTTLVLVPVAVHRRVTGEHVKELVVRAAHVCVRLGLLAISLLLSGIVWFILDLVVGRGWGIAAGVLAQLVAVGLLVLVPRRLLARP